jgi:hypothetical protein
LAISSGLPILPIGTAATRLVFICLISSSVGPNLLKNKTIYSCAKTTTISQFSSIDVVKSAYAFPCKGEMEENIVGVIMLVLFKLTKMIVIPVM